MYLIFFWLRAIAELERKTFASKEAALDQESVTEEMAFHSVAEDSHVH